MRTCRQSKYHAEFQDRMVERYLTGPESYREIAEQEGMDASTLRGWVKRRQATVMSKAKPPSRRVDERTAEEKLSVLLAASALADEELGAFLRKEGLREGDLERWRREALGGLEGGSAAAGGATRQVQQAESRARKAEKRLREAEALLELQKKVHALWGAEVDDTKES